MIEGIIIGNTQELRGIEKKAMGNKIGEFNIAIDIHILLMLTAPKYFDPKTKVYNTIRKQGEYLGANFALITANGNSSNSYNAQGEFYKI